MSLSDFFRNFEQLFLCRFFDDEWTEISFSSEWSTKNNTAGGCRNYPSCGNNPQLKMVIKSSKPMDIFCFLQKEVATGQKSSKTGIGFEIYELNGKKVTSNKLPDAVFENYGGY